MYHKFKEKNTCLQKLYKLGYLNKFLSNYNYTHNQSLYCLKEEQKNTWVLCKQNAYLKRNRKKRNQILIKFITMMMSCQRK